MLSIILSATSTHVRLRHVSSTVLKRIVFVNFGTECQLSTCVQQSERSTAVKLVIYVKKIILWFLLAQPKDWFFEFNAAYVRCCANCSLTKLKSKLLAAVITFDCKTKAAADVNMSWQTYTCV